MTNLIGHSLGRYHILEQLGEGGMAVVYKARDTRLEADVAVKIIRTDALPQNAIERTLKRFEREARALARLTHPNIVKVMDYGEHEGKPYLVMPLLSGGTLKSKLNGKPMPWQDAVQILIPIASALGYAHKHDIVHRDVKPANILITENGQPMLADFGVAKLLEAEETLELTGTGVGIGTPEYMAPEQATNKHVDARADIYALGVVLFEMVTGRKPFIADTPMAVLIMHSRDPLPRPRSFAPNLPQSVENVLIKVLAKDPQNRHQNMEEFAQALEGLLSGKKISKDKKRAEFRLPAIPRRTAVIVALITLGLGLFTVFSKPLSALPAQLFASATPTLKPSSTLTPLPPILTFTPVPALTATSLPEEIKDSKGITMRLVLAGTFTMGSDTGNADEKPVHQVYLDSYYMDIYEVTNAAYKICVDDGKCELPIKPAIYEKSTYMQHPVVYVNWNMAKTYCEWRGARLPTEAEWEKAARGTDGRTYPWGEGIDCARANYYDPQDKACVRGTTPVGKYETGKSPYGMYDMAGNVRELVNDWYSDTYYQVSPSSNPLGPDTGQYRITRGGMWELNILVARSTNRLWSSSPDEARPNLGFRCASSP